MSESTSERESEIERLRAELACERQSWDQLNAEFDRIKAERNRLQRDRSRLIHYIDHREPVTQRQIEDWLDEREAIEGEKGATS